MAGSFPGMNPYLEHPALWPGVHQRIITYSSEQQEQVGARYFVDIGERVYVERSERDVYPDVLIIESESPRRATLAQLDADEPQVLLVDEDEHREVFLQIVDTHADNEVVTIIEVLSPANKHPGAGRDLYLRKQEDVLAPRGTGLVEIDLLRVGSPTIAVPAARQIDAPYHVAVSRAQGRGRRELYSIGLRERLPRVRIPLASSDPDAVLDLQAVLETTYLRGAYARRISSEQAPPPPALAPDDLAWARSRLAAEA